MQHEQIIPRLGSEPAGTGRPGERVGRSRPRRWSRGRIALILAAAVGLPWLPILDSPPEGLPMRRADGSRGTPIASLAFSPDGRTIAMVDDRGRPWLVPLVEGRGHARGLDIRVSPSTAFSPDGRSLAVGGIASDVVLLDLERGGPGRPLGIPVRDVSSLSYSPDGRTLAVSSVSSHEILLWNVEAGRIRTILRGHGTPVVKVMFGPDGRTLTSVSVLKPAYSREATILIWDLSMGRPRACLYDPWVATVAFSHGGRLLAFACNETRMIQVRDARTGRAVRSPIACPYLVYAMAASPDARLLATSRGDGFVSVWSLATGREIRRIDGQSEVIRNLAFSPDGRILAATGVDGDLRLWDLDSLLVDRPPTVAEGGGLAGERPGACVRDHHGYDGA